MVLWRVYYAAVRTLGRPYALTKYAEKKLSSSCPEKVLPSDKNVENAQRALFEHKHNGLLKLYLSARNIAHFITEIEISMRLFGLYLESIAWLHSEVSLELGELSRSQSEVHCDLSFSIRVRVSLSPFNSTNTSDKGECPHNY
ncbi:hypothetical protein YC2023_099094 [Brassica napus]